MTVMERKYALTKIGPGDYLLPSNDAQTVWRISRYEDGPSHGLDDMPKDKTFWGAWRFLGRPDAITYEDIECWAGFSQEVQWCESRAEAIKEALRVR